MGKESVRLRDLVLYLEKPPYGITKLRSDYRAYRDGPSVENSASRLRKIIYVQADTKIYDHRITQRKQTPAHY